MSGCSDCITGHVTTGQVPHSSPVLPGRDNAVLAEDRRGAPAVPAHRGNQTAEGVCVCV